MQGQQNDLDNTICAINVTITYAAQILHSPHYGIIFYSPLFCHSKTKHTQSKVVQQVGQGNIKVNFLIPNKIQCHNITQRYNKWTCTVCFNEKFKVHLHNHKIFFSLQLIFALVWNMLHLFAYLNLDFLHCTGWKSYQIWPSSVAQLSKLYAGVSITLVISGAGKCNTCRWLWPLKGPQGPFPLGGLELCPSPLPQKKCKI